MDTIEARARTEAKLLDELPLRLHHNAYVVKDHEANRRFLEDLLGIPLVATWCERTWRADLGREVDFCHTFFGLKDGGALAFFQFANKSDQDQFGPQMPFSPFHHIALNVDGETQAAVEKRIAASGMKEPQTFVLEHGYCRSVYVTDPNGLIVELTHDAPNVEKINSDRLADARSELKRWLAGDHHSNNNYR